MQNSISDFHNWLMQPISSRPKDDAEDFLRYWSHRHDKQFFFLFRKNLRVTNIQYGELFALLRAYSFKDPASEFPRLPRPQSTRKCGDIQFLTGSRFREDVRQLFSSFISQQGTLPRFKLLRPFYGLVEASIVIEPFRGSCIVTLPDSLALDLEAMCAHAGYVHSCGRAVFAKKADETLPDEFVDSIKTHLSRSGERLPFAVYAHEDFTKHDRDVEDELRDGLDDVKIPVEKYWMGEKALVDVLSELQKKCGDLVEVLPPFHYRDSQAGRKTPKREKALWLIVDAPASEHVSESPRPVTPSRYYICYEQLWANKNPYFFFDENKPAWKSHTTLPHTLAAAMINLTRPWWPTDGRIRIADPFAGTGTTLFEAIKDPRVEAFAFDKDKAVTRLIADNQVFLSMNSEELATICGSLKTLLHINGEPGKMMDSVKEVISNVIGRLEDVCDEGTTPNWGGEYLPNEVLTLLDLAASNSEPEFLLHFYVLRRALIRHDAAFRRDSASLLDAFCHQAKIVLKQFEALMSIRRPQTSGLVGCSTADGVANRMSCFVRIQDSYSRAITIEPEAIRDSDRITIKNLDIEGWSQMTDADSFEKYDVVIADPPYGFNTDERPSDLAHIYQLAINGILKSLKDDGQLVLCLLDQSHTGRRTAFFTNREIVGLQILAKAEEMGFEILAPSGRLPTPVALYRPPYYWESVRALRRSILHFRFRKIKK